MRYAHVKENFNQNDMELFNLNYKIYTTYKNNPNDFIVNFDEVYKWIGYGTKSDAKKVLTRENNGFKINKDFRLIRRTPDKSNGRPVENIVLTINCFKKFCLKASTVQADKIYDYYIKMEEIITKYIENKHKENMENNNKLLQLKDNEIENNKKLLELKDNETNHILELKDLKTNQLLELKNQEIENNKMQLEDTLMRLQIKESEINSLKTLKYEEIDKNKHIYVFSTDKDRIYKVGKTKDVKERKKSLQTGNVDDIITLYD